MTPPAVARLRPETYLVRQRMGSLGGIMKTRGEEMLALRKARMAAAPPFLRGGFRPFFLLAAAWAAFAVLAWLCAFLYGVPLQSGFAPLAWHRHEMLFGFVGAAIVGFLLTAIPNWTGRLPIAGPPLAGLAAMWILARAAVWFSGMVGLAVAAALDAGFYLVFAFVAGREVIAAKNRNVPVVGIVLLFGLVDAWDYAAAAGLAGDEATPSRAGMALVVVLISVIGGRIIPSFTRNWMTKQGFSTGLPGQPGRFDLATIALTALALLGWILLPGAKGVGAALLAAGLLQLARIGRWRGWRTWRDPLVLVLHAGYAWIPLGLVLLGLSAAGAAIPATAAIHALTAGAIATMILAVMTRATLGHTGRALQASPATSGLYACVILGAALRVLTGLGLVDYRLGIELSGGLWAAAFVIFLLAYAPMMFEGSNPK
jgi:uncharacterized protein involved in response to NO